MLGPQAGSPGQRGEGFATPQLEKDSFPLLTACCGPAFAFGPNAEEVFGSQTWMAGSPMFFRGSAWGGTESLTPLQTSAWRPLGLEEPASLAPGSCLGVLLKFLPDKRLALSGEQEFQDPRLNRRQSELPYRLCPGPSRPTSAARRHPHPRPPHPPTPPPAARRHHHPRPPPPGKYEGGYSNAATCRRTKERLRSSQQPHDIELSSPPWRSWTVWAQSSLVTCQEYTAQK